MIQPRFWQLRHLWTGGYLKRIGPFHLVDSWAIMDDWREGGFFEEEDGQDFVRRATAPIAWTEFELVRATGCGCCGVYDRDRWAGPWTPTFREVAPGHWRCEKHAGRLPCVIEGCGRTFAMKGEDTYDHVVMCGAHWRQAPARIRRQCRDIRARAKRFGWTAQLLRLHSLAWHRAHRAIARGHQLDMSEVNKLFGWDDPAP